MHRYLGCRFYVCPNASQRNEIRSGASATTGDENYFNVLGPLTNPAGARRQVLGVFNADLCPVMAAALQGLGCEHVMVVHGTDGLDEISICEPTEVCELKDGSLRSYQIDPKEFGHHHASLDGLSVSTAESAALIKSALGGDESESAAKARSIIALNAGAASMWAVRRRAYRQVFNWLKTRSPQAPP